VGLSVAILAIDILVQAYLVVLGITVVFIDIDETLDALLSWCAVGTGYWILAVVAVALSLRARVSADNPVFRWVELNPLTRFISSAGTYLASAVGLISAFVLIAVRDDPEAQGAIELVAVWAMLLSWALFHWGYARSYARAFAVAIRRGEPPPLIFPRTERPRLADFVYFAFSNGTSFAVSDVAVATTRMRWTVVWHVVFSFFFNALIIVLAINTISSGHIFGDHPG